jgi:hypothetical protein
MAANRVALEVISKVPRAHSGAIKNNFRGGLFKGLYYLVSHLNIGLF